MRKQELRKCIYELYKQEWIHSHLSNQQIKDSIVDYFELVDSSEEFTFQDYVEEYGFTSGKVYACYDEFMDNEYCNIEFIKPLLEDYQNLFEEYKKDLEEEE